MTDITHVSDIAAAFSLSIPVSRVRRYCQQGRFLGATFDRKTWHWRIPYPIHLVIAHEKTTIY